MKTLTAFYDFAIGPTSYDFVVFAVQAEMERVRTGADRLHIVFMPDPNGPGGFRDKRPLFDEHEARWRFQNICVPACALLGASHTVAADEDHACLLAVGKLDDCPDNDCWPKDWFQQSLKNRHHLIGGVIRAAKSGAKVPTLSASAHARRKVRNFYATRWKPIVTMTLRSTYLPERNSDRAAWMNAKRYIEEHGFAVEVIEDTSHALDAGAGYGALNLDLRMACYQEAALNLQANNGAASLCWFSDVPYRMFGAGDKDWRGLFVEQGLPLGASWSWALPQQKLVYGKETADSIIKEFEEWRVDRGVR